MSRTEFLDGSASELAGDLWQRLAEQSTDYLAVVDCELRFIAFNTACLEVYGRIAEVPLRVGCTVSDVFASDPARRDRTVANWRRALAGETFNVLYEHPEPPALYEIVFHPLHDDGGSVVGAFHVGHNVTAHEQSRRLLDQQHAALEARVAERTAQLASAVAELERRKRDAELQRERLRAVLDALPVGVWIADADGRLIARNAASRAIWGEDAPMSERPENYAEDYHAWWPDGRELTPEDWALARALRHGQVSEAEELEIESSDGKRKVILNYALPIRDAAARIVGGVAVNVDITDRRRTQESLRASEERYRTLVASTTVGIALATPDGRMFEVNAGLCAMLGYTPDELTGRSIAEITMPEDLPREQDNIERVLAGEIDGYTIDKRFLSRSGEPVWASLTTTVVRDPAGDIRFAIGIVQDMSARREAELQLVAREDTIRRQLAEIEAIYDAAPVGLGVFDRECRFLRLNERLAEINGIPRDAHLGRTIRELLPDLADQAEPLLRQVMTTGQPLIGVELVGETPAAPGVKRYWLEHYHPVRVAETGEVVGVNATSEEITERKREELKRQFLSEASTVLASSIDLETTLARIAELAIPFVADYCIVDLLGEDGTINRVASAHIDPAMRPVLDEALRVAPHRDSDNPIARVLRTGQPAFCSHMDQDSLRSVIDGRDQIRPAVERLGPRSYLCAPMLAGGITLGSISLVYSVSGRSYAEADLDVAIELAHRASAAVYNARQHAAVEAARREAEQASLTKSQFLATMSHELRTPLTGIIGYTELLNEQVAGPLTERQKLQLSRIKASAWHLVTIIDEILLFARVEAGREQVRLATLDVGLLVQESVAILEAHARSKNLSLSATVPPAPVLAQTDQGKVRQILLNLIGNALKFTEHGAVYVELFTDVALHVRVRDTGPGVAAHQRERIFEPFTQADSTNTRVQGGTGLGLTVSRRLARLLGGELVLEETSERGSSFLLTLPWSAQNA